MQSKTQFLLNVTNQLAKSKKPVVYIAGKVTGLPVHVYEANFAAAKKKLEANNFNVLNPCDFIAPEEPWQSAMRMAFILLGSADHIYLLSNWQDSRGAKMEFDFAVELGITCINE